jgi:hypothetical protein
LRIFTFLRFRWPNTMTGPLDFFSASTISSASQALTVFIKGDGQIRLAMARHTDARNASAALFSVLPRRNPNRNGRLEGRPSYHFSLRRREDED